MTQKAQVKQKTALVVLLVYLLLTSLIMVRAERHALKHEHHGSHAAQHASFICTWMCAASTFVHTDNQKQREVGHLSFEHLVFYTEGLFTNLLIFSFHIRPPPALLS